MSPRSFVGIDLGSKAIFAVEVLSDSGLQVERGFHGLADELDDLVSFCRGAERIAIDAPSDLSTERHLADENVNRKFQKGRCAEIALGESFGIWVPWVTRSILGDCPEWMAVGFGVWSALREAGHQPLEVYPHGVFEILGGKHLPKKQTLLGTRTRAELLSKRMQVPETVALWGHDGLDAAAAALVAADHDPTMRAAHNHPGCDDSAIWLPSRPEAA